MGFRGPWAILNYTPAVHRSDLRPPFLPAAWIRRAATALVLLLTVVTGSSVQASVSLIDTFGPSNGFGSTGYGITSNQARLAYRFPGPALSPTALESVTVVVAPFSPASRMWIAGGNSSLPDLSELDSFNIPAGPATVGASPQVVTVPATRRTVLNAAGHYWLIWEGVLSTREAGVAATNPSLIQEGVAAWEPFGAQIAVRISAQPLGACCNTLAASCTLTTQSICTELGSAFRGESTACSPSNCTLAVVRGACCLGFPTQTCVIRSSAECAAGGGRYFGDRTVCPPPGSANLCCPADVNGSGGTSVQDIFAFLNGYFAGCP